MTKALLKSAALAAFAALAGCASVTVLPAGDEGDDAVIERVTVENTDWRFLCCLPIASGNPDKPNRVDCRWFRDTVTLQNQLDMLDAEARRVGATRAVDVTTYENDEDFWLFVFLRRKMHTSATLMR